MLTTHAKFREFTPKAVCDTSQAVEVLFNLQCESRQVVDTLVAKGLGAGGSTYDKPEDLGFTYSHSFVDPDGHGWGLFHLTPTPSGACCRPPLRGPVDPKSTLHASFTG